MRNFFGKICLFMALVGRPGYGPSRDEVWNWRDWMRSIIWPVKAWKIAGIVWDD